MLSRESVCELRALWLPNITDSGLDRLIDLLEKGSPLLVEGRLRLDQWDDKQTGQKRSKLGVVLEGFQFLGGGKGAEASVGPRATGTSTASTATAPAAEATGSDVPPAAPEEDDVPF